jgi:hypothetical protein
MTANKTPALLPLWMWQNRCYAYAMSTLEKVYGSRFYVIYVNGDYRANRDWVYKVYEHDYTYQELYEQWEAVKNFARAHGLLTA